MNSSTVYEKIDGNGMEKEMCTWYEIAIVQAVPIIMQMIFKVIAKVSHHLTSDLNASSSAAHTHRLDDFSFVFAKHVKVEREQ